MNDQVYQGESLTPVKTVGEPMTMGFPAAMSAIINGKKVARVEWGNTDYCLLKDGWLSIYRKGSLYVWKVNDGDLEGQDWVIIQDKN